MVKKQKRIRHLFLSLALFGFIGSIFIFCVDHAFKIEGVGSENCLTAIGHHNNFCQNEIAHHLAWWQVVQSTFTQERFFILLASLIVTGGLIFVSRFIFRENKLLRAGKDYLAYQANIPLFFSLRMLFSQGILHAKIYPHVA